MRTAVPLLLVVVTATLACGLARIPKKEPSTASADEFELLVTVDRSARRFNLRLVSHSQRQLCLHLNEWPDDVGKLHFAGTRGVYVEMAGTRCNALDRNLGYCPERECLLKTRPGGELAGFIDFSEFVCELDSGAPLKLSFSVAPTHCR